MAKSKAEWLAEARKLKILGLSKDNTVAEIRAAIGKGPAKSKKAKKARHLSPEQEQEQMVAEREERRKARRAEEAAAAAARAENEAAAKAQIRTASQQAIDRLESP